MEQTSMVIVKCTEVHRLIHNIYLTSQESLQDSSKRTTKPQKNSKKSLFKDVLHLLTRTKIKRMSMSTRGKSICLKNTRTFMARIKPSQRPKSQRNISLSSKRLLKFTRRSRTDQDLRKRKPQLQCLNQRRSLTSCRIKRRRKSQSRRRLSQLLKWFTRLRSRLQRKLRSNPSQ